MGYILIKHYDLSDDKDFGLLLTERLEVASGEHILHPRTFKGYKNIPFQEPAIRPPDICDNDWIPPLKEPEIPFGSQRIKISEDKPFGYVEFYYKKVVNT